MDLAEHFGTIWRRRWRILAVTILVTGLVYGWRHSRPPTYQATGLLSVTPARSATSQIGTRDDVQFLAETYGELATTRPVVLASLAAAKLNLSVATATARISVDTSTNPGFIRLTTTGATPAEAESFDAALSANLIATVTQQEADAKANDLKDVNAEATSVANDLNALPANSPQRSTLQAQYDALVQAKVSAQLRPSDRLQAVSAARADPTPISPRPIRDAALAFVVALIVNSELTVLLQAISDRFSATDDAEEIGQLTGLPILARIPRGSDEDTLEAIRTLRAAFMLTSATLRTVAVVGAEQGSGKSFISRRLGMETSSMSIPVLLVDGDLRRPTLHLALDVPRAPGLTDVLQGRSSEDALHEVDAYPWLRVMPAGSVVPDPGSLLTGNLLGSAVKRLSWPELVIVDTPAASFFADGSAIAAQCDVTIVVVNARRSRRRAVRKLIAQLDQAGARPIGVVVNWAESTTRAAHYYTGQRVPA